MFTYLYPHTHIQIYRHIMHTYLCVAFLFHMIYLNYHLYFTTSCALSIVKISFWFVHNFK